jgi:integrase
MAIIYRRGKKWGVDYIDPSGKRIKRIISPYKETARRVLQKIETDLTEGKYFDLRKNGDVRFEDFAQRLFDMYIRLENKNVRDQKCKLDGLVKYFRGKCLNQIDNIQIRRYVAYRLQSVKPASVNRDVALLRCLFNRAIEWHEFSGINPTRGIKNLTENERCRWLSDGEQEQLLSCCEGINKVIVLLALKSGLRWGEIARLKWQYAQGSNYVDFDNNVIFIHKQLSKSKKSRYIPLAQSVKQALMRLPRQRNIEYIFQNTATDKPLGSIKCAFKNALRRAKIKDFTFHDLRHTFASHLVMNGVDLYVVQKLLGHSTIKMTERYAHLQPRHLKDAISKLEKSGSILHDIGYNEGSVLGTNSEHHNIPNFDQEI